MLNNIVVVGRLTRDPELRYIPASGTAVAKFTVAVSRDYKDKNGVIQTDFIPVEVIGRVAENCANYLKKGSLVGVQGSLRIDRFEDEKGEHKTFTKISSRSVSFLGAKSENKEYTNSSSINNGQLNALSEGYNNIEIASVEDDEIPF